MEKQEFHSLRDDVLTYVRNRYGTEPEYLFLKHPRYAVLRHRNNHKWYGVLMRAPRMRVCFPSDGPMDVLNVKVDPDLATSLLLNGGFYPGYRMPRGNWITMLLNGSVGKEQIFPLIDLSFRMTQSKEKVIRLHR